MHGGDWVAELLRAHGVRFVFTLTGGHISPILVGCKERGIRVVDVRHEANAVFAADAVARLTGVPGVAVVTAGPGVTNTVTALKNAQMAHSPLVLIGGAAATLLQGRGALQDIDQLSLLRPVVKWARAVKRVREIVPALAQAFYQAQSGLPGPVFVQLPIDVLYDEALVRQMVEAQMGGGSLLGRARGRYGQWHVDRLFAGMAQMATPTPRPPQVPQPDGEQVAQVAARLAQAERPLLLVGSQALLQVPAVAEVAAAVAQLGLPVYLSGMARGLLGAGHPLQMRHRRRQALRQADFVLLAGVPLDFRLGYGSQIRRRAFLVSANPSRSDLRLNRRPDLGLLADPGLFLRQLAGVMGSRAGAGRWEAWRASLRARDEAREEEIARQALQPVGAGKIHPVQLCRQIAAALPPQAILVADGGDFVATASYILSPPGPLTWLDPGPFGTLGVGAGFALGAKLCRPEAEVWLLYGDGAAGFSLAEFDTFARHGVAVLAVVGNDAGWSQIAREQVPMLGDDVATVLAYTDYDRVAAGFGAAGFRLEDPEEVPEVLAQARQVAAAGRPVLVNALLGRSDFRKGSISM